MRHYGGLGLGLYIVRTLVASSAARSRRERAGVGSTFTVELPRGGARRLKGPTILLVDDDEDIREIISLILEGEGYTTVGAPDGRDALDEFLRKGRTFSRRSSSST